jgi:aminoglycoside phosphotransferase (APT) family kinase protein
MEPVGLLTVLAAFSSLWSEAVEQLSLTLRDACGHLEITGLREIGHGLDARVYRGESASLGPVAIRVPHARWLNDGIETQLDTRLQLRQDFDLSRHLRAHGLPVPEVFFSHTSGPGPDFTIAEYVESDDSELSDGEFGRLIRAIHEVPAPPFGLVCMESRNDADEVLAERIGDRLKNLAAVTELGVKFPDIRGALAADRGDGLPRRLLHMDLRPENILVRAGRPVAILDWSNALIGDPALDLARAAEYGSLTPAALAAYGDPGSFTMSPLTALSPRQAVYRLDTAVMLSHVFLDGAPDQAKARHYIERTKSLCDRLAGGDGSRSAQRRGL